MARARKPPELTARNVCARCSTYWGQATAPAAEEITLRINADGVLACPRCNEPAPRQMRYAAPAAIDHPT